MLMLTKPAQKFELNLGTELVNCAVVLAVTHHDMQSTSLRRFCLLRTAITKSRQDGKRQLWMDGFIAAARLNAAAGLSAAAGLNAAAELTAAAGLYAAARKPTTVL